LRLSLEAQKGRYAVSAFNVYNYEKLSVEAVGFVTQVAWKYIVIFKG